MSGLFASGRIIDFIVVLALLEAAALALYRLRTGRGVATPDLLASLLPGVLLLIAVRLALTGERWEVIALTLGGAFGAHLLDLSRRIARG